MKNVILTKNITLRESIELSKAIDKVLGLTEAHIKRFLRDVGKVFRGISVKYLSTKSVEYEVLKGMKGAISYNDLKELSFFDVLFIKKMLDEEAEAQKDFQRDQERQMKIGTSRLRSRGK